jgi:sulfate adenylyltransferase (ADP) / ATP adenylyltransferase
MLGDDDSICDVPSPNLTSEVLLAPGSLWRRIVEQTQQGLSCGALQSIPTQYEWVEQAGTEFLVRMVANLERKQQAKKKQQKLGKDFNPFLPHEPDLFVADFTPTHLGLLNKFNVVDHHLLIVTRAFESQDTLLTPADFAALWLGLQEYPSLGFYNGGELAGASQRHKHLQLVPLPLCPDGRPLPISPLLEQVNWQTERPIISAWPFAHALRSLDPSWDVITASHRLHTHYLQMRQPFVAHAYNLLVTREWMLLVPRSQEKAGRISVNSLGFAGALLVKNAEQMQFLKEMGPLTLLTEVSLPL